MIVKSICPFCGVGCGIDLEVEEGKIVRVLPDRSHVVSKGHLCGKGSIAFKSLYAEDGVLYPLKKEGEKFVGISWKEAIDEIYFKLNKIIKEYGPFSVGVWASLNFHGFVSNSQPLGFTGVTSVTPPPL
jgi:formate dehydrogenase major subunit